MSLKTALRVLFHGAGGLNLARLRHRGRVRILMYHRFAHGEQRLLERQCEYLRKNYSLVSLANIAAWLRGELELPLNPLGVTVDDGYRDFYEVAYPIFSKYQVPATVFLTTGFLDGECWLWVDRIHYAFQQAKVENAEMTLPSGDVLQFELNSSGKKSEHFLTLKQSAKRMPESERAKVVGELPRILEVEVPDEPPPEYAPLRWEDARRMAGEGIEFGAHTRTHPILARVSSEQMREEIESSKRRIEQELAMPVRHFCYPNGRWLEDFGAEAVEAVRLAGFETAVTADSGVNRREANAYLLKRIGVEPGLPELYFRECAAGLRRTDGR